VEYYRALPHREFAIHLGVPAASGRRKQCQAIVFNCYSQFRRTRLAAEELYSRVRHVRIALDLKQQACRKLVAPEELIPNECGLMLFVATAVMLVSEWGLAWMTASKHSEVNFVV
jgi:hypothetical protein